MAISPIIEEREQSPVKSRGKKELKEKRGAISQWKERNKSEEMEPGGLREGKLRSGRSRKAGQKRASGAWKRLSRAESGKEEAGQDQVRGGALKAEEEASKMRRERLKAIERVSPMMVALVVFSRPNQGERLS